MLLEAVLANVPVRGVYGPIRRPIGAVTRDSRTVGPDDVFVAIRGGTVDGHDLVPGLRCAAVVVDRPVVVADGVTRIEVEDTRLALAWFAAARAGFPSRQVPVLGVTGTNGKTTTATVVEEALLALGRRPARIGTTGNRFAGVPEPAAFTTPEAPELQGMFRRWVDDGCDAVVMEVSSHGLAQRRVDGTRFHTAAFTNLTQDHLDFHGDMDRYREAKARLFRELLRPPGGAPRAVLCADDPHWTQMGAPTDRWTFGFAAGADIRIADALLAAGGLRLRLATPVGEVRVDSHLVGRHNATNLAGAAALLATLGVGAADIGAGLSAVRGVPGRLERVADPSGRLVIVDYAHSPDALEHALRTVRELVRGQLWVVFGCGGDRDRGKRPLMGRAADAGADWVVVTNDNPRSEDPQAIADAVVAGVTRRDRVQVCLDREAAIRLALAATGPGDAVLIAGKGHETTQEQGGVKLPFDDREAARRALEQR